MLDLYQQQHAASHTAAPERTGYAIQALLGFWGERTCDYIRPETCRAYVRWRTRDGNAEVQGVRTTEIGIGVLSNRQGLKGYDLRSLRENEHGEIRQVHTELVQRKSIKSVGSGQTQRLISESTAARELVVLRAALGYAFDNGKLIENCRSHVEVPGKGPGRDRWLTRSEAARLLWESRRDPRARDHLPLFIMLALHTGARSGALFDLRWPQIDFTHNRIDFNSPGRKRTNKGRPIIPIPRRLRWFLFQAHACATSPYVLSYQGHRLTKLRHSFDAARKRAGLGPDVTPHTFRHTCGTWMMHDAVPIAEIAGWLGHSIQKTTELYAHHHPDHFEQARKVMD